MLRMQSSPFVHLLESNDPPDEGEAALIRGFLDENRERMDEIRAMPHTAPELDELERSLEAHIALLSPIRRVPGELLSEIFTHLSYKRKVGSRRIDAPPWLVGNVCRSWRNAALSTSILWRFIKIYEPQSPALHKIYPLSMIETQLERSGNATLEIWIHVRFRGSADHHKALLHALLQHSPRWSVFHLHLRGSVPVAPALSGMHNRIPRLREFVLSLPDMQSSERHRYLSEAPALRKLLITDKSLREYSLYIPSVPWHQITHYRATCTAQQHFDVLLAAPHLVKCGLGFVWVNAPVEYHTGRHAVLPRLRRLKLDVVSEPRFLTHVTAGPTLENLTPYVAVPSFLRRSSSGRFLTQLYLDDYYMSTTAEEVVKVLRETQALRTLAISCGNPINNEMGEVWSAMTMEAAANNICPVLISLVYACKGEHEAIDVSLFPMVQSR
ncbi:hypothetical protein FB45DRAFT_214534 [Roridomyces roridus]|uniref:F-box domain-containing protein n=1 Tax=Roridomyces roridus TaxID=1738132 RepID=A0AAD7BD41_9AGAR|nr:hypothetical protein FB45DRAFT_214534 [Roridomyces roridus]